MSKIDNLTLEIKKYTTIYNDVLVGMHADINDYKNKVINQSSKTTEAINLINDSFQEVREKNSEADKMVKKIIFLHSEALEAKVGIDASLAEFKKESDLIGVKLNHLGENINQIKDELTGRISSSHKELNLGIIQIKDELTGRISSSHKELNLGIIQLKGELTDKVNANHKELHLEIINLKKSNKTFKVVVILSFFVLITLISFLLKNTL
jgi:hypothetical protein